MAGAIPLGLCPRDLHLLQRLRFHHLRLVLTALDESGWSAAQDLLRGYGRLDEYKQQTDGDTQ
jgi:hypothetical protein